MISFVCHIVPNLLSDLQVADRPSAPGSVSLDVSISNQANCDGVERLSINVTVNTLERIVATQAAEFADTVITFESISAGNYRCRVTVEDGTATVDSMEVSCSGNWQRERSE